MARAPKPQQSDEAPGAPEWMVTFSDCMTLLLTFFVLLLSFSSFDDREYRDVQVLYGEGFSGISTERQSARDGVNHIPPVTYTDWLDKGSEKPTTTRGQEENMMKESELVDLHSGMALLISSKQLFLGKGTALSSEGRQAMNLVGSFLTRIPSRIVVSETGPPDDRSSVYFGLPRAWAVTEFLTATAGLDRKRFSISQASSVPPGSSPTGSAGSRSERKVEVVLLEGSIYN